MADRRIVIGAGVDALRAAAELAATGAAVTLVLEPGTAREDPVSRTSTRGITLGGRVARLPMRRRDLVTLLGDAAPSVLASYTRARLERLRRKLEGMGIEERTYEDWVVRRMGPAAHDLLYAAYARHRFGAATNELSVSVARIHHGAPSVSAPHEPRESPDVEIRSGSVRALALEDGRVRGIELVDGSIACEPPVWIARSPAIVARWLGEALDPALRVDAQRLVADTVVRVELAGVAAHLPDELHVLDRDTPFFRSRRTERGTTFDARVPAETTVDEAATVDAVVAVARRFGSFSSAGARVDVRTDAAPRWLAGTHARLRRVLVAWDSLGIAGVGRAGAMSLVDPATEAAFAKALAEGRFDQRELHRQLLDPPVRAHDLDASLLRFVER
jgi:hypothetical protein